MDGAAGEAPAVFGKVDAGAAFGTGDGEGDELAAVVERLAVLGVHRDVDQVLARSEPERGTHEPRHRVAFAALAGVAVEIGVGAEDLDAARREEADAEDEVGERLPGAAADLERDALARREVIALGAGGVEQAHALDLGCARAPAQRLAARLAHALRGGGRLALLALARLLLLA